MPEVTCSAKVLEAYADQTWVLWGTPESELRVARQQDCGGVGRSARVWDRELCPCGVLCSSQRNSTLALHCVVKQLLEAVTGTYRILCVTGTRGACVGQHGWQVARWQPAAPPWWG